MTKLLLPGFAAAALAKRLSVNREAIADIPTLKLP